MLRLVPPLRSFRVRIFYREPTYELSRGARRAPYSGTFVVEARDESEAKQGAIDEFNAIAKQSSVGWVREILEVCVSPA